MGSLGSERGTDTGRVSCADIIRKKANEAVAYREKTVAEMIQDQIEECGIRMHRLIELRAKAMEIGISNQPHSLMRQFDMNPF